MRLRKLIIQFLIIQVPVVGYGQTIESTISGGKWGDPTTWIGGAVPTASNASQIIINGNVTIDQDLYPAGKPLVIDQTNVAAGNLTIVAGAELMVRNGTGDDFILANAATLIVNGKLKSNGRLNIDGDIVNNGVIDLSDGTINFAGTSQHISGTPDSTYFAVTTVDAGASVVFDIPFTSRGLLTINDSVLSRSGFTAMASMMISQTGSLTIDSGSVDIIGTTTVSAPATLNAAANVSISFNGNISASGDILVTGITAIDATTVMTGSGVKVFNDLIVSGALTLNAVCSVTGDILFIDSGMLNPGGNTVIFSGLNSHLTNEGTGTITFNDLTIAAGASLTSDVPFTVNASFVVAGEFVSNAGFSALGSLSASVDTGSITLNNSQVSVGGTLTVSSGATMIANESAEVLLTNNLSITGSVLVNSTIHFAGTTIMTGAGNKTFNNIVVSGSFTPNAAYSITGDISINGILNEGTSTTTFAGDNSSFLTDDNGSAVFHNILVATAAQLTTMNALKCNGTCRVSGVLFANSDVAVKSTFTVSRGGKFSSGYQVGIAGNFAISGSFNSQNMTRFFGTTAITGAGSRNFHDIIIEGSLTASSATMNITGNILNNGTFVHNNGTLVMSGDSEKTISSSLASPAPMGIYNLVIEGGLAENDLSLEMDIHLGGALTIITTVSPVTLDVDGVHDDKTLTLLSLGDHPAIDASITALPSDATINGQITIQRYLSGEGRIYRYLCTPVQGPHATVANWQQAFTITGSFADPSGPGVICDRTIVPTSPSLFYYSEPLKQYVPYPASGSASENPLTAGTGYAAFIRQCSDSTLISESGSLVDGVNRGSVSIAVTNTDSVLTFNNLIGNPFPSAIQWDKIQLSNVSPTLAIRDNGTGIFHYYTSNTGDQNFAIAQGQAFWIRTTGASPSVIVSENAKVLSTASENNQFYRTVSVDMLEIIVNGNNQQDQASVMVLPNAVTSGKLDPLDAPKMNNQRDDPYEELFDAYTTIGDNGVPLAVNAIAGVLCHSPIFLSIKDLSPGDFKFSFRRTGVFQNGTISVVDDATHVGILPDPNGFYHFQIPPGSATSFRQFAILFNGEKPIAGIKIEFPSALCQLDTGRITLLPTQVGVTYTAIGDRGAVSDTLSGTGRTDFLNFLAKDLATGFNSIKIKAIGSCDSVLLDTMATIKIASEAAITFINAQLLQSNSAGGNRWSLNGVELPDTSQILPVMTAGLYKLTVTIGRCVSTKDQLVSITDIQKTSGIDIYPNPAHNFVWLKIVSNDGPETVRLFDLLGRNVLTAFPSGDEYARRCEIDVSYLPAGVYVLVVKGRTASAAVRLTKL